MKLPSYKLFVAMVLPILATTLLAQHTKITIWDGLIIGLVIGLVINLKD